MNTVQGGIVRIKPNMAILLLAASFLFSCLFSQTALAKGAPEISNPGDPAAGIQTLNLSEIWRIGGPDDEDNLLGVINNAHRDEDGNIYLLDIQLTEVQVFSPDGMYLRTLGKQGEGPGEIRRAADFLFLPDGSVGLVQGFPGKIVKVDRDGLPAGEFKPGGDNPTDGGFFALRHASSAAEYLVISGTRIIRGDNTRTAVHFIATFDGSGNEGTRFLEHSTTRAFRAPEFSEKAEFFPHNGGWALASDGRVVVAPERNDYRLNVYDGSGTLDYVITRPFKSLKRSSAEKDRAKEMMMPWRRRNRSSMNIVVEPTERDIQNIHFDDSGDIWVLTSRGIRDQPEGIHSTWDVFDAEGKFNRQVRIACPADGQNDTLFFVGAGTVILVKEHANALFAFQGRGRGEAEEDEDIDDAEPLEVICYRILN